MSNFRGPDFFSKPLTLKWYCYDIIIRCGLPYDKLPPHLLIELLDMISKNCSLCKHRIIGYFNCGGFCHQPINNGSEFKFCAACTDISKMRCIKCTDTRKDCYSKRLKWIQNKT